MPHGFTHYREVKRALAVDFPLLPVNHVKSMVALVELLEGMTTSADEELGEAGKMWLDILRAETWLKAHPLRAPRVLEKNPM